MPPIPFADNFMAGSVISLLFPVCLLIAIAVWYVFGFKRFRDTPSTGETRAESATPPDAGPPGSTP